MRHIQPEMVQYLDEKLFDNGLAQKMIADKNARGLMVEAAKVCVGIREKTNRNDGPMVELIQRTIGKAEGESWCMSFVQTMAAYAEVKTGMKCQLFESEHCLTVWNNSPIIQRVKFLPLPGAVGIWRHGVSTDGHTCIVIATDGVTFHAVEGNTNAGTDMGGKVERDGGGVYFTIRSMSGNADMHIVGFLKPF